MVLDPVMDKKARDRVLGRTGYGYANRCRERGGETSSWAKKHRKTGKTPWCDVAQRCCDILERIPYVVLLGETIAVPSAYFPGETIAVP